jgi:hypothetical protein
MGKPAMLFSKVDISDFAQPFRFDLVGKFPIWFTLPRSLNVIKIPYLETQTGRHPGNSRAIVGILGWGVTLRDP